MKIKASRQFKNQFFAIFSLLIFCFAIKPAIATESYFEASQISFILLDRPYENKSPERIRELIEIKKIQKSLKSTDIEEAAAEREFIPELVANKIDDRLSRHAFPKLYQLLDRTGATSKAVVENIKNHWQITRPYLFDKNVKALIPQSGGYSYPSGHTTGAEVYSYVLTLLLPQKKEELKSLAEKIGWHRVQVGMHYPQDVLAGKKTALLIVGSLLQNKDFKHDFEKAKKELKEAEIIQ